MAAKTQQRVVSKHSSQSVITKSFIDIHYLVVLTTECLMDIPNSILFITLLINYLIPSVIHLSLQSAIFIINNCRINCIGIKVLYLLVELTKGKSNLIHIAIYLQVIIITTLLIVVIISINSNLFWYIGIFGIYNCIFTYWIGCLVVKLFMFNVCGTFQPPGGPQQKPNKFSDIILSGRYSSNLELETKLVPYIIMDGSYSSNFKLGTDFELKIIIKDNIINGILITPILQRKKFNRKENIIINIKDIINNNSEQFNQTSKNKSKKETKRKSDIYFLLFVINLILVCIFCSFFYKTYLFNDNSYQTDMKSIQTIESFVRHSNSSVLF